MFEILKNCSLCPRNCNINRFTEKGYCKAPVTPVIFSYFPHKGEEPPISGKKGSGTVFFSFCPLQCLYCQNYKFSHQGKGKEKSVEEIAEIFIELQGMGCHNINIVTGTHFIPWIREAIDIARKRELNIPIVWNTSGYENPWILELLKDYVDVYLVDFRYLRKETAQKYSNAPDYPDYAQESIKEMFRQKRTLEFSSDGTLKQGVIVRILALPGHIQEFKEIVTKVQEIVDMDNAGISIMTQYTPFFKACEMEPLNRPLNREELQEINEFIDKQDFSYGWIQKEGTLDKFAGEKFKEKP